MSMTSPGDAAPVKPPPSLAPGVPLAVSKTRLPDQLATLPLDSGLADSRVVSSPTPPSSSATTTATTAELPIRSASRSSQSRRSTPLLARSSLSSSIEGRLDGADDVRSLIIRSFSPSVAVYASPDTDDLVRDKGFKRGFRELIRPFGDNVAGKVVIRDSVGSSRSWEDYGVRFVALPSRNELLSLTGDASEVLSQLEEVLEQQLDAADDPLGGSLRPKDFASGYSATTSPLYRVFLRQLLSAGSFTPHETFLHPVACVIAISSRNTAPLESLRQLYADTNNGPRSLPGWAHPEYLRYYVLVHDEDHDNIAESIKLYDQMKRHFGLHCHLLRLRSSQCVVTDDDSVEMPACEWLSPAEHLSRLGETETLVDLGTGNTSYIFESDVLAINTFVRELVAQSVIPFMENKVALWNDQVASRRRGISGRFMSMSRRWAGFGSGSRSGTSSGAGGASGNYDATHGVYRADTPEAILRRLADFAFMLRDWKLATSIYELLRSDYANDKAWKYHAGAHEMCAVSMLLNPLAMPAKTKIESIDQMFETACYSYLTRCTDTVNTLRTLTMAVELLKSRGGTATDSAAKWGMRIMELGLVGPVGQILISERVSVCYASRTATSGAKWGGRPRKAGMWNILAAELWLKAGKPTLAALCLEEAERLYADVLDTDGVFPMPEMQTFVENLRHAVRAEYLKVRGLDSQDQSASDSAFGTEETSEQLDVRNHRRSLIGLPPSMDAGAHHPLQTTNDLEHLPHDDFERA